MAYKTKIKKTKVPSPDYFRQRDIRDLRKKKHKSFKQLFISGERQVSGFYPRVYEKGRMVQYGNTIGQVEKVTRQGIHIRVIKRDKQGFPTIKAKKTTFVPVSQVEKGGIRPFFTNVPDLLFATRWDTKLPHKK